MISQWTIYWIMQLDSIRGLLKLVMFPTVIATLVWFVVGGMAALDGDLKGGTFRKCLIAIGAPAFLSIALLAFIPTSKTAAAMVLIPAIANNETVQKEAGELYQLAKDGLRELVTPEKEKSK